MCNLLGNTVGLHDERLSGRLTGFLGNFEYFEKCSNNRASGSSSVENSRTARRGTYNYKILGFYAKHVSKKALSISGL